MNNEDMKSNKRDLRKKVLRNRDKLPLYERTAKSAVICTRLQHTLAQLLAGKSVIHKDKPWTVLSFIPFGSEVDVLPFAAWCWQAGLEVAVPRTLPSEHEMVFHRIADLQDTASAGPYGIREPRADLPVVTDPAEIAMIVMPGTAFDIEGNRLGYGGGYYDWYLARLAEQTGKLPPLVAPCFELQIIGRVPAQPHDRRMDIILTEDRKIQRDV